MKITGWFLVFMSVLCLFFGYDKKNSYKNDLREEKNVYVKGDAYNYIINGTYTTANWVLSSGFLVSGILLIVTDSLKTEIRESGLIQARFLEVNETVLDQKKEQKVDIKF